MPNVKSRGFFELKIKILGSRQVVQTEPGCREFNITISQSDPNHVFIFEVYDNAAVLDAHRQTDTSKSMLRRRRTWSPNVSPMRSRRLP